MVLEIWFQMYGDSGGSGSCPYIKIIVLMDKTVIEPKPASLQVPFNANETK